ncbi:MAG: hypothetical protein QM756_25595 [Polyangiaceae bacterium]
MIALSEGVHDFRDAARAQLSCPSSCTNDPQKPLYRVLTSTQTCAVAQVTRDRTERTLSVASNKTIVGLGRGAALRGVSMDLGSSQNIVVRNVALFDVNPNLIEAGDAFNLNKASQVWLDHCTIKRASDGFTEGSSKNTTLSWMHYDGVTPFECDGQHTLSATFTDATVTVHHSFFDHVETHSPTVHNASSRVHLFNNLLADNLGYGVGSVCGAQVLLEGNVLERVAVPTSRSFCDDDTNLGLISAPEGSNWYRDDVGPHHGGDGKEPHDAVFKPAYSYTLASPQAVWLEVLTRAGTGGPWAQALNSD